MRKNPELDEEIKALSDEFGIPIQEIKDLLKVNVSEKPKAENPRAEKPKVEKKTLATEVKTSVEKVLNFEDFEQYYVNAKNEKEEIKTLKKFLPACKTAKEAKSLYDLCPETEEGLRDMIIHEWIILSKNLSELLEPKSKVKKNTPDSKIAFDMYMKFYF